MDDDIERLYADKVARGVRPGGDAGEALAADLRRVAAEADGEAGGEPDTADRLELLLRRLAGLHRKRKLNIVAVTPESVRDDDEVLIKGAFMANFGGFFDRGFRAHDFEAGRAIAHRVLRTEIGECQHLLDHRRVPEPAPLALTDAAHADFRSVERGKLERFVAFVPRVSRARRCPAGASPGWCSRPTASRARCASSARRGGACARR